MKTLLLNFDIEEFDRPLIAGLKVSEDKPYSISSEGTEKIIKILDEHNIKSTFFVTTSFALKKPEVIEDIISRGHEIASHGLKHTLNYALMPADEVLKSLKEAKEGIEKRFNIKISGFRAPRLRGPSNEIIKKAGFAYDSSLHPTYVPGRYNNIFKPRKIHDAGGLTVVPISTTPLFRLPFSWVWFRYLGLSYAKFCTKLALLDQDFINILFHPWEFVDLKKDFKDKLPKIITKNTGKLVEMLDEYIKWCMNLGMEAKTIRDYLQEVRS